MCSAYQDNWIGAQALTLLKRRPKGVPFFLEVSHQAPHPPMDITAGMMAFRGLRGRSFPPPVLSNVTAATVAMGRQNYAAKIERLDYWLGEYVTLLAAQGALASTVVCIASDHGEMLFDRSSTAKSKPWSSASSVPLVCSGPGVARNAVSGYPVSTVDLAPTFLDLAGVPAGTFPPGMSTYSLAAALAGTNPTPPRPFAQFGLNNFRGLVHRVNTTHVFKFFCCAALGHGHGAGAGAGAGGTCPGSTAADQAGFPAGVDEHHLFNIVADR